MQSFNLCIYVLFQAAQAPTDWLTHLRAFCTMLNLRNIAVVFIWVFKSLHPLVAGDVYG